MALKRVNVVGDCGLLNDERASFDPYPFFVLTNRHGRFVLHCSLLPPFGSKQQAPLSFDIKKRQLQALKASWLNDEPVMVHQLSMRNPATLRSLVYRLIEEAVAGTRLLLAFADNTDAQYAMTLIGRNLDDKEVLKRHAQPAHAFGLRVEPPFSVQVSISPQ